MVPLRDIHLETFTKRVWESFIISSLQSSKKQENGINKQGYQLLQQV